MFRITEIGRVFIPSSSYPFMTDQIPCKKVSGFAGAEFMVTGISSIVFFLSSVL
jgi:hypothetical protein